MRGDYRNYGMEDESDDRYQSVRSYHNGRSVMPIKKGKGREPNRPVPNKQKQIRPQRRGN